MEEFCKAMFFNCDISLLKYGYYREADAILKNFKIRLRKIIDARCSSGGYNLRDDSSLDSSVW